MRTPSGLRIDSPSWPLLQAHISYWNITSGAGNVLGTTLVDANLANEPNYAGLLIKILDGGAAGQVRPIASHIGNTITVAAAWTNAAGGVQQIAASTRFVILSVGGGGGAPPAPPSPGVGLWMFGVCDPGMAASNNTLVLTNLAGFNNDLFNNEFWIQVIHNASAPGTAPEREIRRVLDYAGATGTFTTDAFSVNVEANDLVCVFHESIMAIEILGFGTLTVSNANTPRDGARTEGDDYFNGCLLMTTEGAVRFQPRRVVDYDGTVAPGTFTLDPNNPLTALPGLVDYVIIGDQTEFVPAVDGVNNRTPSDVIGGKADTIPAMNLAPVATDSLVRHVKAILERIGATPADPDDSLLTIAGQRDDAATADDMSGLATASLVAELKRVLLRLSSDAFTATIQGAARTELDTMLAQLATYISALGAAYSATVNPGAAAKTNIEQTLEDLGDVLAGAGITTYPAAAPPGNGVSIAEVIRQIYDNLAAVNNAKPNIQEVVIYPVAEDADVTELADDGTSPPYYPAVAASTNAVGEGAAVAAWSEDINFEQEGTITIISIYAEFEWQTRFLIGAGNGVNSVSKIQISRDGGANWVDLTDNFTNSLAAMTNRIRAGVGRWISTIVAGANQLQLRLVHWVDVGNGISTSEAQIRSNSYIRVTYRKS